MSFRRREPSITGVIAATRGNHGQSIAFAAKRAGLRAVIVVPYGNSAEKNAAMRSLGAELIEHGNDFQEAYEYSARNAAEQPLHLVRSFDPQPVGGVASYALELCRAVAGLDAIYAPIGMGSGICGCIAVRDALGLRTEIVAVTAESAPSFLRSYEVDIRSRLRSHRRSRTAWLAGHRIRSDGDDFEWCVARCGGQRERDPLCHAHYFFRYSQYRGGSWGSGIRRADEADRMKGRRVAVILSGGNVDSEVFGKLLLESAS